MEAFLYFESCRHYMLCYRIPCAGVVCVHSPLLPEDSVRHSRCEPISWWCKKCSDCCGVSSSSTILPGGHQTKSPEDRNSYFGSMPV